MTGHETSQKRSSLLRKNILVSFLIKGWSAVVVFLMVPVTLHCLGDYKNGVWLTISSLLLWIDNMDIGLGNGLRNKLAAHIAHGETARARSLVSSTFAMLTCIMLPAMVVLLAIILIIMILIMLFKDYKKPAIIFCCIPLIFVGEIPAVLLTGKPFGFVAIVGVLGLIGMMIKNGIVLMDEINLQISKGIEPKVALVNSSKSRLRPVMMASLTTILGMIPLIPDAMFGSLAVTIMGGLFVGTLITLIFIPVLYAMFFKIK